MNADLAHIAASAQTRYRCARVTARCAHILERMCVRVRERMFATCTRTNRDGPPEKTVCTHAQQSLTHARAAKPLAAVRHIAQSIYIDIKLARKAQHAHAHAHVREPI